jgi:hypothetical protein
VHLVARLRALLVRERGEPRAGRPDLALERVPEVVETVVGRDDVELRALDCPERREQLVQLLGCPVAPRAVLGLAFDSDCLRCALDRREHLHLHHAPHADRHGSRDPRHLAHTRRRIGHERHDELRERGVE